MTHRQAMSHLAPRAPFWAGHVVFTHLPSGSCTTAASAGVLRSYGLLVALFCFVVDMATRRSRAIVCLQTRTSRIGQYSPTDQLSETRQWSCYILMLAVTLQTIMTAALVPMLVSSAALSANIKPSAYKPLPLPYWWQHATSSSSPLISYPSHSSSRAQDAACQVYNYTWIIYKEKLCVYTCFAVVRQITRSLMVMCWNWFQLRPLANTWRGRENIFKHINKHGHMSGEESHWIRKKWKHFLKGMENYGSPTLR